MFTALFTGDCSLFCVFMLYLRLAPGGRHLCGEAPYPARPAELPHPAQQGEAGGQDKEEVGGGGGHTRHGARQVLGLRLSQVGLRLQASQQAGAQSTINAFTAS